ncbi:MAG: ATP-binding protein [Nitrospirota bacterium]
MKKKIVIGLSLIALIFLLSGVFIIFAFRTTTSKFENLVKLHQVEILREHLLIQIQKVQSELKLSEKHYTMDFKTVIRDVMQMEQVVDRCFDCHHSGEVQKKIDNVKYHIEKYKEALSRFYNLRTDNSRLTEEYDQAFWTGEELITKINDMIIITSSRLDNRYQAVLRDIADIKNVLYVFLIIAPFFALCLAFFFIKGLTKPINALLNATRKIKEGNLNYRVEDLKDEFGEVAASFNEMANSLRKQMIKIQQTEQLRVCGELSTGLAHEIKNPLAGIKVSMEFLYDELTLSQEDRTVLSKAIDEIRRIELLMKNLLNFARPPVSQLMPINVNDIINRTISLSMTHPSFFFKGKQLINILKDLDDNLPETMADPMQLQQVFLNLLLNAAEAMPDGGTVVVKTYHDLAANSIHLEISDTGKGIDKRSKDKIFQPFFTTKPKGTGLGLAITKRLVEQQGGSIFVRDNPDGGTIFTVSLDIKLVEEIKTV